MQYWRHPNVQINRTVCAVLTVEKRVHVCGAKVEQPDDSAKNTFLMINGNQQQDMCGTLLAALQCSLFVPQASLSTLQVQIFFSFFPFALSTWKVACKVYCAFSVVSLSNLVN